MFINPGHTLENKRKFLSSIYLMLPSRNVSEIEADKNLKSKYLRV